MSSSPYSYQHYLLRSLCAELNLPNTKTLALQPGIQGVIRITCHYPEQHPPNSVATLISSLTNTPQLTIHYEKMPNNPLEMPISPDTFKQISTVLSTLKFDRLEDQPEIAHKGHVLWLIERAAVGFSKGVLLAPETAKDTYQTLIYRLHELVPQMVEPQQ